MSVRLPYADPADPRIRKRFLKVFHCADFHIKSTAGCDPAAEPTLLPLQRAIDFCLSEGVDLLLIAGDFLESSLITGPVVDRIIHALAALAHIPVILVTGNHDPLGSTSFYVDRPWGNHVAIVGDTEVITLADRGVRIWCTGFMQMFRDAGVLHAPGRSARSRQSHDFLEIGLAHGDFGSGLSRYNPLTPQLIAESGLDYLALGHIHQPDETVRKAGATAFAYSGSAEGRGFGELGERGGLLCVFQGAELATTFVPLTDSFYWEYNLDISLPDGWRVWPPEDLAASILRHLEKADGPACRNHHYRLILEGDLRGQTLDLDLLQRYLARKVREVRLKDATGLPASLAELAEEPTVRGYFVRDLLAELRRAEQAGNEAAVRKSERILRLGLDAFGREGG